MDMSQLANKMLEWERLQREADALRVEIEAAVLEIGKTQTVGNVRATYSNPRKSYDYQAATVGIEIDHDTLEAFTKYTIDWRGICKELDITEIPYTEGEASVSLKLTA